MDARSSGSLTPLGFGLLIALVLGIAALFAGPSHTVQLIGFIVVVVIAIVLLVEFRPRRAGGGWSASRLRTGPTELAWPEENAYRDREHEEREEREERERTGRRPGRGA